MERPPIPRLTEDRRAQLEQQARERRTVITEWEDRQHRIDAHKRREVRYLVVAAAVIVALLIWHPWHHPSDLGRSCYVDSRGVTHVLASTSDAPSDAALGWVQKARTTAADEHSPGYVKPGEWCERIPDANPYDPSP